MASLDISGSGHSIIGCNIGGPERQKQVYQVHFVDENGITDVWFESAFDPQMALVQAVLSAGLETPPERVVVRLIG